MTKLLKAFRAKPSLENAEKLRVYDLAHPMASCMLTREDGMLLNAAIHSALTAR